MAVQQITHKKITKFDTSNPNYKETPKPKVEVSGNVQDDNDVYGERVGLSANEFLQLDRDDPVQERKYFAARDGIPRAISIAEPNKIAN